MHLVSNINWRPWPTGWMRSTSSSPRPGRHPSGAPKVRAMEIIAELEDSPRGPYGGAIGYVSFSGNMDLAITIRTACIQKGVLTGGRGRHRGRFRPRSRGGGDDQQGDVDPEGASDARKQRRPREKDRATLWPRGRVNRRKERDHAFHDR